MKEVLRIIIALIFIASGFVKAVDVRGFSFKLEEYFSPAVFNIGFLEQNALPIAIFVVVLELVLGVMLLLKIKLRKALMALIVLCIFFAFLTFYSAFYNKVTDCGCFGDALKLTPWQSFYKDIALLIGLIILWFGYAKVELENKTNKGITGLFVFFLFMFGLVMIHGIRKEPLIDFRDYKIGTNLNDEIKKIEADPSEFKTIYTLKNKTTNEEIVVNQDDYVSKEEYWKEGTPWEILTDKTESKMVKEGYSTEISKFKLMDTNQMDRTPEVLQAKRAVVLFSYYPKLVNPDLMNRLEKKISSEKNTFILGVSSEPGTFKTLPETTMDATAIKTIARSNPFVLILENGKIVDKKRALDYLN